MSFFLNGEIDAYVFKNLSSSGCSKLAGDLSLKLILQVEQKLSHSRNDSNVFKSDSDVIKHCHIWYFAIQYDLDIRHISLISVN